MPEEQKATRKLRAILSADVKGYSLLMADDEAYTIRKLEEYRTLMSTLIGANSGRVVDAVGDNLLAEFASAVDAVQCAVEIQKALKEKNAEIPADKQLNFRIGINIGDVVQDGDRIYGGGVNVAARIEGFAEPGGVCISRNVYEQIKEKLTLEYEYLGNHKVKNIRDPVIIYKVIMSPDDAVKLLGDKLGLSKNKWLRFIALFGAIILTCVVWYFYQDNMKPDIEPASINKMAFPLPDKPSIAVLPFVNMSEDKDQEYFADGITEDLITDLSKVSGLFVVARNSTFVYKGTAVKAHEIAETLGVRYLLEGSVRRSGDQMRINVQLIDALTGSHIWAERYDRKHKDIFVVQDDVNQKVVSELAVTLKTSEQERLFRKHTENLEAYETFLRARRVLDATEEDTLQAKRLFERVIELDPGFAGGYAGLSLVYARLARHGFSASPKEDAERALNLAQRAIAIDDTFGWSYMALASAYLNKLEHDKAIAAMEEAIHLQPGSADAHLFLGFYLHWAGHADEAIDSVKKSMRLNPRSIGSTSFILGMAYFTANRYEDVIATIKPKYEYLTRKGHLVLCFLAASYAAIGQDVKAHEVMKVFLEKHPNLTLSSYPHLRLYKKTEDRERYANLLRRAGMPEKPTLPLPE